ncbi:MAG: SET domain-containing protein-lysine N-methyltransferase [bacterium]
MEQESRKIYIGKSKLHGKGLFALRDLKRGEVVFFVKGKKINFFITDNKKAKVAGMNWVGVGKNEWLDPEKEYSVFFNHSCNPSTAIKGKVTVVALHNIKKDEEITFDYSTTEGDIFWSMRCNCGEKNCRKVIKSIQFLPSSIFRRYSSSIPKYYKMIYRKFNFNKFHELSKLKKAWIAFLLSN